MKVYLVLADEDMEWSDQNTDIHGVFLTKELAVKYIKQRIDEDGRYEDKGCPFINYIWSIKECEVQEKVDLARDYDKLIDFDL